jgi:hypothetical protein
VTELGAAAGPAALNHTVNRENVLPVADDVTFAVVIVAEDVIDEAKV